MAVPIRYPNISSLFYLSELHYIYYVLLYLNKYGIDGLLKP